MTKIVMDDTLTQKTAPCHKLKHSACNLKKIARLPVDDRKQVLKILMKKVHRRIRITRSKALNDAISKGSLVPESSSSASVNNDWKRWAILRGKDEVVKGDINFFGRSLGVKFYNDKANQFRVLSRGQKQKKKSGKVVDEGTQKE